MTGFILRIYFIGLLAFVPSQQGDEVAVLLVDARTTQPLSDDSLLAPHMPLLVARTPGSPQQSASELLEVANFVYPEASNESIARLQEAIDGGVAWKLDGSALSFRFSSGERQGSPDSLRIRGYGGSDGGGGAQSTVTADPEDFGLVAEIGKIVSIPGAGVVDADVLAAHPKKGLIVARMRLSHGELRSHRLVSLEDDVVEVEFRPLGQDSADSALSQPVADRVVAEIEIPSCETTLQETHFDGQAGRSVTLRPRHCDGSEVVEVALLNLPPDSFGPPDPSQTREVVGKHFEMLYALSSVPIPKSARPVPYPRRRLEAMSDRYIDRGDASPLLRKLQVPDRGVQSRPLCPVGQYDEPETGG